MKLEISYHDAGEDQMNLWLRLLRVVLTARRRGPVTPLESGCIRVRVWPHDLDLWGHVNGGRYLTLSDLGRLDLFIRSGLMDLARRNRWVLPIGSAVVRYRRPLRLFQTCELRTRVLGWDEKWTYLETAFVRSEQSVASVIVKGLVRDRDGNVAPARVMELLGDPAPSPQVPERIRALLNAESTNEQA